MTWCLSAGARRRLTGKGPLAAVACLLVCILLAPVARAEDPRLEGTSSDAAQQAATRVIPWSQLSHQDRRIAQFLVKNHSVFRRMPTRVVACDPEVFTFLAQRPEVVAGIWNVMGVSQLEVKRTSPTTFQAADNAGTQGALRVMHADWGPGAQNRVLLYAEGVYEAKPLPGPVKAHSLMVLQSASAIETNGQPYVTARLDSFIYFERAAADLVAKTISPLISHTADHNFVETMKFVSTFSQTTQRNPEGVARLAERLDGIDEGVRSDLVNLCRQSAARDRQAAVVRGNDAVR